MTTKAATKPTETPTLCVVPFCRRSSARFPHEWLCADHWRLVDRPLKSFRTKYLRRLNRRCVTARRWAAAEGAIWARMKRQAIERAAGASA